MAMNKKGRVMAEAAVVFPIVILVVMTIVYILINLYLDAAIAAREHLALRHAAGLKTETVDRTDEYRGSIPLDKFGRAPFGEEPDITEGLKPGGSVLESEEGRVYVIDERKYIRRVDFMINTGKEL